MALGFTMSRPTTDKYQQTESELKHDMAMMLAGRAAEKVIFNELTAGASNDIERATMLARRMVVDFGMSTLGPVSLSSSTESNAWGFSYGESGKLSETTQSKVDEEIKKKIDIAYELAEKIIKKHKKILDKLSLRIIEVETLEQEEFEEMVGMGKGSYE
jgi:cell division protease FtsH